MADASAAAHDPFAASTAPLTFAAFLEKMRNPAAADIVRAIKAFLTAFAAEAPDSERDAERVQEFLRSTEAAFRTHALWRGASEEELEASGEGLEKYLMTKIHGRTFGVVAEDVERDKLLSARMEALQFIKPDHIEIPQHHRNEQSWMLAQKELQKINAYKAPRDKLVCVLNCCRVINNLLAASASTAPPGADDFLPVLVLVLLRAAPPQLASNLAYVARFRLASRLVSETAYFYTNLVSAAAFLESAQAAQFKGVDAAEFAARMKAAGLPAPPLSQAGSDSGFSQPAPNTPIATTAAAARNPFAGGARGSPPSSSAPSAAAAGGASLSSSAQPQPHPGAPAEAASLVTRWTVDELSAVGAAMLASDAEDADGALARKHRFVGAAAGALTLAEVPQLLEAYCALAQRHEALLRGVALMLETSPTGPQAPSAPPPPPPPSASFNSLESLASGGEAAVVASTAGVFADLMGAEDVEARPAVVATGGGAGSSAAPMMNLLH